MHDLQKFVVEISNSCSERVARAGVHGRHPKLIIFITEVKHQTEQFGLFITIYIVIDCEVNGRKIRLRGLKVGVSNSFVLNIFTVNVRPRIQKGGQAK